MKHYKNNKRTGGFTLLELMTVIGLIGALALAGVVAYKGYREYADESVREKAVATLNDAVTQWKSITGTADLSAADFDAAVAALSTATPKGSTATVNILKTGIVASDYDAPLVWDDATDTFS